MDRDRDERDDDGDDEEEDDEDQRYMAVLEEPWSPVLAEMSIRPLAYSRRSSLRRRRSPVTSQDRHGRGEEAEELLGQHSPPGAAGWPAARPRAPVEVRGR
jgi:hypothetical protein